jgi:hypothetical protein
MTREELLKNPFKWPAENVPCPELIGDETMTVRTLSAKAFLAMSAAIKKDKGKENAFVHWIINTVVDDKGKPIFTAADEEAIAEWPFPLISRLTAAASKLNAGEDAEKNS